MKNKSLFLDCVGDNPRMRIVQHFIEGMDFDYTLTDLLHAGVSWGTINAIVPDLVRLGMVKKSRKIGNITLYRMNKENLVAKQMIRLYDLLILQKLNRVEKKTAITAH